MVNTLIKLQLIRADVNGTWAEFGGQMGQKTPLERHAEENPLQSVGSARVKKVALQRQDLAV
jgi:hypothetical protein